MSMTKLDPKFSYNDTAKTGGVYYTKRGQKLTAKVTLLSPRIGVVEYSPDENGTFLFTDTFRPNYGMTIRELRNRTANHSRQTEAGLSFWVENDDRETTINNLAREVTLLQEKVTQLSKPNNNKYKLMLSVGDREIANYKIGFNMGDSLILMGGCNKPVAFVNVSSKGAVVTYDDVGRYLKTYPMSRTNGLITNGDIREVLKEAGFDGMLMLRKDEYANAYRENVVALLDGKPAPNQGMNAPINDAPQQTGGKFILWAPDSNIPPRVIMEGRAMSNSIAEQMHARHGKTFYVAQLVRKVETVTKVVKTTEKKVTDLV